MSTLRVKIFGRFGPLSLLCHHLSDLLRSGQVVLTRVQNNSVYKVDKVLAGGVVWAGRGQRVLINERECAVLDFDADSFSAQQLTIGPGFNSIWSSTNKLYWRYRNLILWAIVRQESDSALFVT